MTDDQPTPEPERPIVTVTDNPNATNPALLAACAYVEREHHKAALFRAREALRDLWDDLPFDSEFAKKVSELSRSIHVDWLFRRFPCPQCGKPCEYSVALSMLGPHIETWRCDACGKTEQEGNVTDDLPDFTTEELAAAQRALDAIDPATVEPLSEEQLARMVKYATDDEYREVREKLFWANKRVDHLSGQLAVVKKVAWQAFCAWKNRKSDVGTRMTRLRAVADPGHPDTPESPVFIPGAVAWRLFHFAWAKALERPGYNAAAWEAVKTAMMAVAPEVEP